jgi:hypothetical protein
MIRRTLPLLLLSASAASAAEKPAFNVKSAKEWTEPRDLKVEAAGIRVRVHPGDVQVVGLLKE